MAQNFEVNYNINVVSAEAVASINSFVEATRKLTESMQPFRQLNTSVNNLNQKLIKLNAKTFSIKIDTSKANNNIDKLIGRLAQVESMAKRLNVALGGAAVPGAAPMYRNVGSTSKSGMSWTSSSTGTSHSPLSTVAPAVAPYNLKKTQFVSSVPSGDAKIKYAQPRQTQSRQTQSKGSSKSSGGGRKPTTKDKVGSFNKSRLDNEMFKNLNYKLIGPTPLDVGGILGVDLLKGMGIAYGISGIGSLMSNVLNDYTDYNNIMQTAKNILGAHDKRVDFGARFADMEKQVRNVGVETKFTAPQVADASKFLAMAGFDVDAINKSIAPIADIALVGDTDLGETADVVTNIMTGYDIAPEKIRKAADIMTMTFTKSNTTLMEIAEAYKYSASLLAAGNVPFEEATAALGILGNAGIKGSQAGTTMRTIMANIVNPTKKQAEGWKKIGVSRTDKNGNVRDIVDIFQDLNKKDLSLSDYYQIFHKTAAQGAVSLANDVEGWNDIIKNNFMSDGLVKELADEKKNTIQGLWAQLTSMFTENGIEAFEEIQQPIKDFLSSIIGWLKTDQARIFIKDLSKDLLNFGKKVVDFTKYLIGLYEKFRPIIDLFVEFQLKMLPFLATFRILQAGFLGVSGVVKFSGAIAKLIGRFTALNAVMKAVNMQKFARSGFGVGSYWANNYNIGAFGEKLAAASPEARERLIRLQQIRAARSAGANGGLPLGLSFLKGGGMLNALGGAVGGYLGGNIGYEIGNNIGGEYSLTSLLLGGVGTAAGTLLPQFAGPIMAFAASNPITAAIVGVTAAVAGLGYAIYRYNKSIDECVESSREWVKNFDTLSLKGIDVMKQFGLIQSYQAIEATGASPERKREMRQQVLYEWYNGTKTSIKEPDASTSYSSTPIGDGLKNDLEIADRWSGKYKYFMPKLEEMGLYTMPRVNFGKEYKDYFIGNQRVWEYQPTTKSTLNEQQATQAAMILAGYAPDSPIAQKVREIALQDVYGVSQYKEVDPTWKRIRKSVWPQHAYTYNDKSSEDVAKMNTQQLFEGYYTQIGLNLRLQEIQKEFADWEALIYRYDNGLEVEASQIQQVLFNRLGDLFDPQNGLFGSEEFTNHLRQVIQDPNKYGFDDQKMAIAAVQKTFSDLLDFFNLLDVHYKPLFASYLNRNIFESVLPEGASLPEGGIVGGKKAGDTKIIDGVKYTWKPDNLVDANPAFYWFDSKGKRYTPGRTGRNGKHDDTITPGTHNSHGVNESDYKQHYNNNLAAPKQVIVKIENLMNVKSVDLSKSDNKEAVDNIKAQLTQALVDVVHDFDATFEG